MSEQKTLGDKIQYERKNASLSQEALGEKLGVSRQAVSKWESDAAIPELENLIAMSRIFKISVGQLLGVEIDNGAQEQEEEDGGLTDRELTAVEHIAEKYAAEASGYHKTSWTRSHKIGVGVVSAVAVLAVGLAWYMPLKTIQSRLDDLQFQVNQLQSHSVVMYPTPGSDKENSILATWDVQLLDFDREEKTITLGASARPLESAEDTSVVFSATTSNGTSASAESILSQGAFSTNTWIIPMDESLELTATVTTNGVAHTQAVETLYDCTPESFQCKVWGSWEETPSLFGKHVTFGMLELHTVSLSNSIFNHSGSLVTVKKDLKIKSIELGIYRNGAAEPEQVFHVDRWAGDEFAEVELSTSDYTAGVEIQPGDSVVAAAKITDSWDQTSYVVLSALHRGEKSAITSDPAYEEIMRGAVEWVPGTVPEQDASGNS